MGSLLDIYIHLHYFLHLTYKHKYKHKHKHNHPQLSPTTHIPTRTPYSILPTIPNPLSTSSSFYTPASNPLLSSQVKSKPYKTRTNLPTLSTHNHPILSYPILFYSIQEPISYLTSFQQLPAHKFTLLSLIYLSLHLYPSIHPSI